MTDRKSRLAVPLSQLLLLLLGILIIYLVVDFGRQVLVSHQRRDELRQVEARVEAALLEGALLEERLVYAQSPEAAEAWARNQGWAKPGEVPVVIIAPEGDAPSQTAGQSTASQRLSSIRQGWLDLFFAER